MNKRISISPKICHGQPVITGTRVLVRNILAALAAGDRIGQILEDYHISQEDVFAAIEFGKLFGKSEPLSKLETEFPGSSRSQTEFGNEGANK